VLELYVLSDPYGFAPAAPSIIFEVPAPGFWMQSKHAATLRDVRRPRLAGWSRKNYAGAWPMSWDFRIRCSHHLFGSYRAPRRNADPHGTRRRRENRPGASLHAPRLTVRNRHRVLRPRSTANPSENV